MLTVCVWSVNQLRRVPSEQGCYMFKTQRTIRDTLVVSLLPVQFAQSEGTVNAPPFYVFVCLFVCLFAFHCLKASSGLREMGRFYDRTWGCGDCYSLHGLGSQRVAGEEKYQVPSSSFWGVVSCKGAATSLVPRTCLSPSVSVFACLCLRHSEVSSAVKKLPLRSSLE